MLPLKHQKMNMVSVDKPFVESHGLNVGSRHCIVIRKPFQLRNAGVIVGLDADLTAAQGMGDADSC